jgi:hypothetical protein
MNFLFSLLSILSLVSSITFDPATIEGRWYQVYSNRYVQRTLEISYTCVTIDVVVDGKELQINKTAYNANNDVVSYNYTLVPLKPTKQEIMEEKQDWALALPFQSDLPENPHFRLRQINDNYLLWTQEIEDGEGLYVWTRNFIDFKTNDDWVVLAKFNYWNFSGYYDFPIKSFDYYCMIRT